jgi:ADP-dependent NAD(P)H-hydrate dehydratase / NAD(P)H-hydrate epimerase
MQKVLTAEEMREVDRLTTEKYGIPSILLMENAAHAAARVITEKLGGSIKGYDFLILCGKGNNGGDGAALGRLLWRQGAWVHIYLFGKIEDTKGDARINFEILEKLSNSKDNDAPNLERLNFIEDADSSYIHHSMIGEYAVIDALFGTGLSRELEGEAKKIIAHLREWKKELSPTQLISIDLPSGLNADYGEPIGATLRADLTITFTAPKTANVISPASSFNGELIVVNIGSPQELIDNSPTRLFLAEKEDAQKWIEQTEFTNDSYKNKRGHALLIVGSHEYTGAAVLAGNAAMLSGVGLTTIATSESAQTAIAAKVLEEVITRSLPETKSGAIDKKAFETVGNLIGKVDVVGIGCGLGSAENTTKDFVREVVTKRKTPVVIDADGLNALSPFDLQGSDDLPLILTPHEGEFLRLLGMKDKDAIKDRVKAVRDFAEKHRVILVLKGERVLVGAPDGTVVVNPTGNSGLGKAGNGDTLTGIITGFIAQTMQIEHLKTAFEFKTAKPIDKIFEATVAAVYLSGLAGDIAAKKFGKRSMLASDVRECLAEAFAAVSKND